MMINVQTAALSAALSKCARALATRTTLPVLCNVRVRALEVGQLELTCSDGKIVISANCPAEVFDAGALLLDGKLLLEIVRKLSGEQIHIESEGRQKVTIKCGKLRTTLQYLDADTYPQLPVIAPDAQSVELAQPILKRMISQTSHAISVDESRMVLTGAYLEIGDGAMSMTALDGYRMARTVEPMEGETGARQSAIIPGDAISEVYKQLSDAPESVVRVLNGGNRMRFELSSIVIETMLIEGEYVNYERVTPKQLPNEIRASIAELRDAITHAMVIAGDNHSVQLDIAGDTLGISANSLRGDMLEEIHVDHYGDDMSAAFNTRYLLDALASLEGDNARLRLGSGLMPWIVESSSGTQHAEHFCVVLPVRRNG